MVTKHFLKTLVVFMAIIVLGLIGLFAISYFGEEQTISNEASAIKAYEYLEDIAK